MHYATKQENAIQILGRFGYHSPHIHEHIKYQVTVSGLMRVVFIDAMKSFHGTLRHKEAHAIKQAPGSSFGHATGIA